MECILAQNAPTQHTICPNQVKSNVWKTETDAYIKTMAKALRIDKSDVRINLFAAFFASLQFSDTTTEIEIQCIAFVDFFLQKRLPHLT